MSYDKRLVSAIAALALGCSAHQNTGDGSRSTFHLEAGAPQDGLPTLLVLMPWNETAGKVLEGMRGEVSEDMALVARPVSAQSSVADIEAAIAELQPVAVVLMNNPTVRLYARYQREVGASKAPPAVVLLSSFVEKTTRNLSNAAGIAYEIPGVTLFTNLRALSERPIKKVGVIHRPGFRDYVEAQRRLLGIEEFELAVREVSRNPSSRQIILALDGLAGEGVDVIWILNDNGILRPDLLGGAWVPVLGRLGLPVVVGVRELVHPTVTLGTYAVRPDHVALGAQAGELLFELMDADWDPTEVGYKLPISVRTAVDAKQASSSGLRPDYARLVDEVVATSTVN